MSITDRKWTPEELRRVTEDNRLATILANSKDLPKIAAYTKSKLKSREFQILWGCGEVETVFAMDEESLGWFLFQEYIDTFEAVEAISEVITEYRSIPFERVKLSN